MRRVKNIKNIKMLSKKVLLKAFFKKKSYKNAKKANIIEKMKQNFKSLQKVN